MKTTYTSKFLSLALLGAFLAAPVSAQAQESVISYRGALHEDGAPAAGLYDFEFKLFDDAAAGSQVGITQAAFSVQVVDGRFTVNLDFGAGVWDGSERWLELAVRVTGSQQAYVVLSPRNLMTSVPYAVRAANATELSGSLDASKLTGTITANQIAPGSIDYSKLTDTLVLGDDGSPGNLYLSDDETNKLTIRLLGGKGRFELFTPTTQFDAQAVLTAQEETVFGAAVVIPGGALSLKEGADRKVYLKASSSEGGTLSLNRNDGSNGVDLKGNGSNGGGTASLYQADGDLGVRIYGQTDERGGAISLRNTEGQAGLRAYGGETSGAVYLYGPDGKKTFQVTHDATDGGGELKLVKENGVSGIIMEAQDISTQGAQISLYNSLGERSVIIDSERGSSGDSRIVTDVLEIRGGSDLSEQFEISNTRDGDSPSPGMIVCIDPNRPGHLKPSSKAHDRTVAGIISGAGGVRPGMLMGQRDTLADGAHPVALTGRVYCYVDTSHGPIEPGDLITTSDTPGNGMKVTNHDQARGAIIGKAMTSLEDGTGLVLVLVSLQ